MAAGVAGDLHMRIVAGEGPHAMREIALHDLHMVEVELQLEVGVPDPLDHRHRLGRRIEEIARDVAVVDRLDDDGDAFARQPLGRMPQIRDIDALGLRPVASGRQYPGHCVQQLAVGRLGVAERRFDPVTEFLLAPHQGGSAALAGRPVAGGHVEQRLDKPVTVQLLGDDLGRMLIRGEILDRLEAAFGGGGETVEKPEFLKDEAEIGGEFRHGAAPLRARGGDSYSFAAGGLTQDPSARQLMLVRKFLTSAGHSKLGRR